MLVVWHPSVRPPAILALSPYFQFLSSNSISLQTFLRMHESKYKSLYFFDKLLHSMLQINQFPNDGNTIKYRLSALILVLQFIFVSQLYMDINAVFGGFETREAEGQMWSGVECEHGRASAREEPIKLLDAEWLDLIEGRQLLFHDHPREKFAAYLQAQLNDVRLHLAGKLTNLSRGLVYEHQSLLGISAWLSSILLDCRLPERLDTCIQLQVFLVKAVVQHFCILSFAQRQSLSIDAVIYGKSFNYTKSCTYYYLTFIYQPPNYNTKMSKPQFALQQTHLQDGLFRTYRAQIGAQTILNINCLPDLLQHIKNQLLPEELLRLEVYYLQNYLIQLALGYKGQPDISELVSEVLGYIRSRDQFWYRHNNRESIDEEQELKHHAIESYRRDIQCLQSVFDGEGSQFKGDGKMAVFAPYYARRTSPHFCCRVLASNNQTSSRSGYSMNHLAYVPRFLTLARQQPQNGQQKGQKIQCMNISDQRLQIMMKQCMLFVLKNLPVKIALVQSNISINHSEQPCQNNIQQSQRLQELKLKQSQQKSDSKQTLIDEFIQYFKAIPNMPKFYTNQHIYSLTHNLLLVCQHLKATMRQAGPWQCPRQPSLKYKKHSLQDSVDVVKIPKSSLEILNKLSQEQLNQAQSKAISDCFIELWRTKLRFCQSEIQQKLKKSKEGWITSQQEMYAVKQSYEDMLARPEFTEMNKFKMTEAGVPWTQQQYKLFLQGLAQFINVPTNNKKIAAFMGEQIEPNHVKHVKGSYLLVMKDKMERGECGGGKRGKCLSKSDFIEKDIASFSMKCFKKSKKIKKPIKRKPRNSSDQEVGQDDSSY